jgi:hypothetical protein
LKKNELKLNVPINYISRFIIPAMSSCYVIHVPVGVDVSRFIYNALATKDIKKRRIDTPCDDAVGIAISATRDGSFSVSMRDHILSRYRGDVSSLVKNEVMPKLVKCT